MYFWGTGLAIAAVVLTKCIGAVALAITLTAYLLSGFGGSIPFRCGALIATGFFAYAIAIPWTTPSVIATIRANAPRLVGFQFSGRAQITAAAIVIGVAFVAWPATRWRLEPRFRFGILFALLSAAIPLVSYWGGVELVPQAGRYHVLLDLAVCVALALALPLRFGRLPAAALVLLLVAAAIPAAIHQRALGRLWIRPLEIQTTLQYQVSSWLGSNLPGSRVFAPGSIGFWMNSFSDTPMLTGGFDNGARNLLLSAVNYQIYAGDSQELAIGWMNVFGVDAVIACEKGSREFFNVYQHPDKFKGMKELWRDGGDAIYAVPRASKSLVHALLESDTVRMTPVAYNLVAVEPYLRALSDPSFPPVDFRWIDPSRALPPRTWSLSIWFPFRWRTTKAGTPGSMERLTRWNGIKRGKSSSLPPVAAPVESNWSTTEPPSIVWPRFSAPSLFFPALYGRSSNASDALVDIHKPWIPVHGQSGVLARQTPRLFAAVRGVVAVLRQQL
jgi:hypothetical protein